MFHRVKEVFPLRLKLQFFDGITKTYDVNPLFNSISAFKTLKNHPMLQKMSVAMAISIC